MPKGFKAAMQFHEENNGLGFTPFTIKEDGGVAMVRILQHQDLWPQIYIHQVWEKVKQTRCLAVQVEADGEESDFKTRCPLCMAECPRSLKVYVPMRVRGDEVSNRVQIAVYGRDGVEQIANAIEELGDSVDITWYDYKIKRKGLKLDTKYFWNRQEETKHELTDTERALEIPNMYEIIPLLEVGQVENRAQQYIAAMQVTAVDPSANGSKRTPF